MYKVRTFNQIAVKGLDRFSRDRFEVGSEIPDPHAILLRSEKLTEEHLTPNLRAVARAGAGVNNIPVQAFTDAGIVVFNTPGANANSVKELVMAALLISARNLLDGVNFSNSLSDLDDQEVLHRRVESQKKHFKGREIYGKTLGVVGLGAIGSLVARAALDMGMDVLGYDPAISVDAAWRLPSEVQRMENLPSLFARSDFVTLHVPLLESTRGFINAESLKFFKPNAILLNFARQDLVEETALSDALQGGKLAGYFSDFPSTELRGLDRVVSTPHLGASTGEAEENCAIMAADQLINFLKNGNIQNSVNFPMVILERNAGARLAVTNRNVPAVLGEIMAVLAERNINVIDLLNKSRDDVAYNLIDVDGSISGETGKDILAQINAIEPVINVRVFED